MACIDEGDKQVYNAYVAICPLDEKHEDGEDVVGVYVIHIETLDYDSGEINTLWIMDIKG